MDVPRLNEPLLPKQVKAKKDESLQVTPVNLCCGIDCSHGINLILPILLWIQFYLASQTADFDFETTQFLVFLFCTAGFLYRHSRTEATSVYLQVLPEFLTDIILLLVLLGYLRGSILFMNLGTVTLCIDSAWAYWLQVWETDEEEEEEDSDVVATDDSLDYTHHERGIVVA